MLEQVTGEQCYGAELAPALVFETKDHKNVLDSIRIRFL